MHACCPCHQIHRLLPLPVSLAALPVRLPLYLPSSLARRVRLLYCTYPPTHLPTYPSTHFLPVLFGGGGLVHTVRGTEDDRLKRAAWTGGSRNAVLQGRPAHLLWPLTVAVHAAYMARHLGRGKGNIYFP